MRTGNHLRPAQPHPGRFLTPEDVGRAVALVCSPDSKEINGAEIVLDRCGSVGTRYSLTALVARPNRAFLRQLQQAGAGKPADGYVSQPCCSSLRRSSGSNVRPTKAMQCIWLLSLWRHMRDFEDAVDSEVAEALAPYLARLSWKSVELGDVPRIRKNLLATLPAAPASSVQHENVTDPALNGYLRTYRPVHQDRRLPCLYWIHGGGYMVGSPLVDEAQSDRWAESLPCVVVAPGYRQAPEHPYPAAVDDCYSGLRWVLRHAEQLGVDPDRLVIAGASAGGGIAAALAIMARDKGELAIRSQILIYPMLDDRYARYPSGRIDNPLWGCKANELGWRAYLGQAPGGADVSPYASAPRATDLASLPPAFISVGTIDLLRDEAIHYALRLLESDVDVELHVYPGAAHGFNLFAPDADVSRRFGRDVDSFLARAFR